MKRFCSIVYCTRCDNSPWIFFTNKVMYLKKNRGRSTRKRNEKHFRIEDFDALHKEEIHIPSQFGYDLHAITFLLVIPISL